MITFVPARIGGCNGEAEPKVGGRTSSHDAIQPCIDGHGAREIEKARYGG